MMRNFKKTSVRSSVRSSVRFSVSSRVSLLSLLPLCSFVSFLLSQSSCYGVSSKDNEEKAKIARFQGQARSGSQNQKDYQERSLVPVVRQSIPSVVSISCTSKTKESLSPFAGDPFFNFFFGGASVRISRGSGVIVHPDGYVATCAHVVNQADSIKVTLSNNISFHAKIVSMDEACDLALLKIDKKDSKIQLPCLEFLTKPLEVGEPIVAIGNPFGVGQTVTHGIVSAVLRVYHGRVFSQTDASINPGNSGGPIITLDGKIAGLASAIATQSGASHGVGFFVPASAVENMLLNALGKSQKGWVPIKVQTADASIIESLCEKKIGVTGGVVVVESQHPDLKAGDVILSVSGQQATCKELFDFFIMLTPVGQETKLSYVKGVDITEDWPQLKVASIKVGKQPSLEDQISEKIVLSGEHPLKGVSITTLNETLVEKFNLRVNQGAFVLDAPNQAGGLQKGDVICELNSCPIKTAQDVVKALTRNRKGFSISVQRGNMAFQQMITN